MNPEDQDNFDQDTKYVLEQDSDQKISNQNTVNDSTGSSNIG